MQKPSIPKGTRDFSPEEMAADGVAPAQHDRGTGL